CPARRNFTSPRWRSSARCCDSEDWLVLTIRSGSPTDFSPSASRHRTSRRTGLDIAFSRPLARSACACSLASFVSDTLARDISSLLQGVPQAQPAKPSAFIFASYGAATWLPGVSVALTLAQSSGLRITIQPSPYGSWLASDGCATRASLIATTSPPAADFAGPTHLPDSTVAHDLPASVLRPTFFGVKATSCPAIAVATVVMPIFTVPSSCSLNQM